MNNALIVAKLQILVHLGCPGFADMAPAQPLRANMYCQQSSFYLTVPNVKSTMQELKDAERLVECLKHRDKQEAEDEARATKCDIAKDELRAALGIPKPKFYPLTSGTVSILPTPSGMGVGR